MALHTPVTDRILRELERIPGCDLDTLTKSLPDLSWNQVFLEVDRLSREGMILVTFGLERRYTIRLPEYKADSEPRHTDQRSSRRGS